MRGSVYDAGDEDLPRELGFEVLSCDELVALSREEYGRRVRERVGDGPLFLSFDIDVLDPAFAPGTGTPEAGGLTTREALGYVRALRGLRFGGYDVVEVSPPYDGEGKQTAVAAANVAYELLTLDVLAGRAREPAQSGSSGRCSSRRQRSRISSGSSTSGRRSTSWRRRASAGSPSRS